MRTFLNKCPYCQSDNIEFCIGYVKTSFDWKCLDCNRFFDGEI